MPNWLPQTITSVQEHDKQVRALRKTYLEAHFRTKLQAINKLTANYKLEEAEHDLNEVKEELRSLPPISELIERLVLEADLLWQIGDIRSKTAIQLNRHQLRKSREQLQNIEQQARQCDLATVADAALAARNEVYIDESRVGIAPRFRWFDPWLTATILILLGCAGITSIPFIQIAQHPTDVHDALTQWASNMNPEMVGALFTFLLLSVIFERILKNRERRQEQHDCYQDLIRASTLQERQTVINYMKKRYLLRGAYFVGIDCEGLDLRGADFTGANLRDVINLDKAITDPKTKLPKQKR